MRKKIKVTFERDVEDTGLEPVASRSVKAWTNKQAVRIVKQKVGRRWKGLRDVEEVD